jgi:hypothetical protein
VETLLVSEVEAIAPSAVPAVVEEQTTTSPEVESTEEAQTPSTDDSAEASSGETEATETSETDKPKKNGFQDRISELNRQKKEAQQRADDSERRYQLMEKRLAESSQEQAPYPTLESHGYDEESYQRALIDYATTSSQKAYQKARIEETQAQVQEERNSQMQFMVETFKERAATFAETQPDYFEKLSTIQPQSQSVQEVVFSSDVGPELAYHLSVNPKALAEINQLSPVMAGKALAAIEAKLASPVSVKTTNTPDPLKPVTPSGKVEKDPSDMTTKEYVAYRRKQGR